MTPERLEQIGEVLEKVLAMEREKRGKSRPKCWPSVFFSEYPASRVPRREQDGNHLVLFCGPK